MKSVWSFNHSGCADLSHSHSSVLLTTAVVFQGNGGTDLDTSNRPGYGLCPSNIGQMMHIELVIIIIIIQHLYSAIMSYADTEAL